MLISTSCHHNLMNNQGQRKMTTKVADSEGRLAVLYEAHEDSQFDEETADVSLNCFGELAIVPVGFIIDVQAAKGAYNTISTKVEGGKIRACRKINRGMSFHYQI